MADSRNGKISVLVLDDDEVMRELLSALLEAEEHHVVAVSAGEEALGVLQRERELTDIVLTDLRMPDADTVTLLGSLRAAITPEARLIGMSGSDAQPEELAFLDGFLLKPFSVEEFLGVVERARAGTAQSAPSFASAAKRDAPVLDETIYRRMAGSLPVASLQELYRLTLQDVQQRMEAMQAAAASGDAATCKSEAHAMKGGCGMVGAMELRAIAADIETGAPVDNSLLSEMAAAAERLRRMLDTLT